MRTQIDVFGVLAHRNRRTIASHMRGFLGGAVVLGLFGLWCAAAWRVFSSPSGQRTLLWLLAAMAAIVAGGALIGGYRLLRELWRRGKVQSVAAQLGLYAAALGAIWGASWLVAAIIGAPTWAVFLSASVVLSVSTRR